MILTGRTDVAVVVEKSLATHDELRLFSDQCASREKLYLDAEDAVCAGRRLHDELASSVQDRAYFVSRGADDRLNGIAVLDSLPWDSKIYGMRMGRVTYLLATGPAGVQAEIQMRLVAALVSYANHNAFRHLCVRAGCSARESIHALESGGFRTMDTQVTLHYGGKRPEAVIAVDPAVTIAEFVPADLEALQELSAVAYVESRLFADRNLPVEATRELHRLWIENDCRGRAQQLLVAHLEKRAVGYIACLIHPGDFRYGTRDCGDIDLISVDSAARGRGVGGALVEAALMWFLGKVDDVVVKTQVTNYRAIALYQRSGFLLRQAQLVLHRFLEP